MKLNFIIILLLSCINFNAQTTFRKGSLSKVNEEKEDVFIQVYGEKVPSIINYKKSLETNEINSVKLSSLDYLEVFGKEKYMRKNVQFETLDKGMSAKASNNSSKFNKTNKSVILKVLLENNNFKLLLYSDENTENEYFFVQNKNSIELLSYKEIKLNNKIKKIKEYRKELFKKYKINGKMKYGKLNYSSNDLIKYFKKYLNQEKQIYHLSESLTRDFKDAVNLNLSLGNGLLSQDINNEASNFNTSSTLNSINLGLQAEIFFNNTVKTYSFILDSKYYLNGKKEEGFDFQTVSSSLDATLKSEFSMFMFDLKIRKYWLINRNNYFFGNLGIGTHKISDKTNYILNRNNAVIVDVESNNEAPMHYSLGIGYNYKNFLVSIDYLVFNGDFDSFVTTSTNLDFSYNRKLLNLSLSYVLF